MDQKELTAFNEVVPPRLDAAYNLARWLTRTIRMLKIWYRKRHSALSDIGKDSPEAIAEPGAYDCTKHILFLASSTVRSPGVNRRRGGGDIDGSVTDPENAMLQNANREMLKAALEDLPMEFREAIVLREMEGFSYKEIADISAVPIGTVMSRLARARKRLQISLTAAAARNYS